MDPRVLERALQREKSRRAAAEQLLEKKSRELYRSHEELKQSHEALEKALTEIKLQQNQLIQTEKMASLGIMSAGIAHEINNPLAFVNSNVHSMSETVAQFKHYYDVVNPHIEKLIERSDSDQSIETAIDQAEIGLLEIDYLLSDSQDLILETLEGIARVKSIVSALQSFSRTDNEEMEVVDIGHCIDGALRLARSQIKSDIDINLCSLENELPAVYGYPGRLSQVFLNLIINAVQAMQEREKPSLSIASLESDDTLTLSFRDTGCGMDTATITKIFTPFFTTKGVGEGTGLGLSISHGIIEKHRGSISVDSIPGEGSTFHITLPKFDRSAPACQIA